MSGIATIIIGQPIRAGGEDDFIRWQRSVTDRASGFPGYLGSELAPPTPQQPDWTAVYRFDSAAKARTWLDSSAHQDLIDRAAGFFAGPGTRQIIGDDNEAGAALVTVVVTRHVAADRVGEFLAWHDIVTEALRRRAGFRGV